MSEKELRRNLAVFQIGIVRKLTDLTARQIRYYESRELIMPSRTSGNQRLFSLNDIDRLLEIKDLLAVGETMESIAKLLTKSDNLVPKDTLSDDRVRALLRDEFMSLGRFS